MNSNTFQDRPGQKRSPTSSAACRTPTRAVREQAVEHNIECIEIGETLGSKALTVWIGDGSNFPGQRHFTNAFERYLDSDARDLRRAARRLARLHRAQALRAGLLLDRHPGLGHELSWPRASSAPKAYLPGRPRPPRAERQHRDDRRPARSSSGSSAASTSTTCKYGDDDLDAGSINPYQLFLVFNELVDAERARARRASSRPT